MSKINDTSDYPVTPAAGDDIIIGTDVSDTTNDPNGETVNFEVAQIANYVQQLTFTTTTAMTLAQATSMVEANHAGAETITLPASAPAGSLISVVQSGAGATSVAAPAGETLNGVTAGSCTLTEQYSEASFTKYAVAGWVVSGDVGAVA